MNDISSESGVIRGKALAVAGVRMASCSAGLYPCKERPDLALVEISAGSRLSLATTTNRFAAAPIEWCRSHLPQRDAGKPCYVLINAANANAGTGQRGLDDVASICQALGKSVPLDPPQFLPMSTGVIGEYLPIDLITARLPGLVASLSGEERAWDEAAAAMMTTDTLAKVASVSLELTDSGSPTVHLCGVAKGSGMIHPAMATMLAVVACDARVDQDDFDAMARQGVARSFNRISVDGDTSTNDACLAIATGQGAVIRGDAQLGALARAIESLMNDLAAQIIADGEGASVVFSANVQGARSEAEAVAVAQTVVCSPLVKTAIGARDVNWGRILAAIGRAPGAEIDVKRVDIDINGVAIVRGGQRDAGYTDAAGARAMARPQIEINIDLHLGDARGHYHGCDLSDEYVRINKDYRS